MLLESVHNNEPVVSNTIQVAILKMMLYNGIIKTYNKHSNISDICVIVATDPSCLQEKVVRVWDTEQREARARSAVKMYITAVRGGG